MSVAAYNTFSSLPETHVDVSVPLLSLPLDESQPPEDTFQVQNEEENSTSALTHAAVWTQRIVQAILPGFLAALSSEVLSCSEIHKCEMKTHNIVLGALGFATSFLADSLISNRPRAEGASICSNQCDRLLWGACIPGLLPWASFWIAACVAQRGGATLDIAFATTNTLLNSLYVGGLAVHERRNIRCLMPASSKATNEKNSLHV